MSISSRVLLWIPWSKIAVKQETAAISAATRVFSLNLRSKYAGEAMNDELEASLIAVTACANALEAIYGELLYAASDLVPSDKTRPDWKKTLLALDSAFELDPTAQTRWESRIRHHFSVARNPIVHHKQAERPLQPQAAGILTAPEMGEWDARTATASVDLLVEVVETCGAAPVKDARFTQSRDELAINAAALGRLRSG